MEAAPRLPMVSLEPKESQSTPNFGTVFRQYLILHYGESSSSYDKEIAELDSKRNAAVKGQKDNSGLEALKRYFFELKMLYPRFPMNEGEHAAVEYSWRDNFTSKDIKSKDPKFEEANILYNIGALHSILGTVDPRKDSDNMKTSCQHFQCAAGAFERIRSDYPQMPSFDQSYDVLTFYIALMLAQAHECILEKSLLDNRKNIIIAKVAAQVVEYYKELLRALDNEATLRMPGMEGFKDFIPRQLLELKVAYYQAMMNYHLACQADEGKKYGEIIAYLQAAVKELDACRKIVKHTGDDECAVAEAFVRDIVQQKLTAAEKDNNFIYHERVPDVNALPAVKGTPIGKAIRFNEFEYLQSSKDGPEVKVIFERLLPMTAYERSSLYSSRKDALLREYTGTVQWKDGLLMSVISALRLEQLKVPTDFNVLPQSLLNNMSAIRAEGDVQKRIDRESESLNEMTEELQRLIQEANSTLGLLENVPLEKNQATELDKLLKEIRRHSSDFAEAVKSTDSLLRLIQEAKPDLIALSGSVDAVRHSLPSLDSLTKNENVATDLNELYKLLSGVEKMKAQRQGCLAGLKAQMDADDITKRILVPKDGELETFLETELKKHDVQVGYLKTNIEAQDELISRLTIVVERLSDFRAGLLSLLAQRDNMFKAYDEAYHSYDHFNKKIVEGLEFYRDLKENLTRAKSKLDELFKQTPLGMPKPKLVRPPVPPGEDMSYQPGTAPQGPRLGDYLGQPRYADGTHAYSASVAGPPKSGRPTLKDYLDAKKNSQPDPTVLPGIINQMQIQADPQFTHQQPASAYQVAAQPESQYQVAPSGTGYDWSPQQSQPTYNPNYQHYGVPQQQPAQYSVGGAQAQSYPGQATQRYYEPPVQRPSYQPVVNVQPIRPPTVRQPPPPPASTPALFSGSLAGSGSYYTAGPSFQPTHSQPMSSGQSQYGVQDVSSQNGRFTPQTQSGYAPQTWQPAGAGSGSYSTQAPTALPTDGQYMSNPGQHQQNAPYNANGQMQYTTQTQQNWGNTANQGYSTPASNWNQNSGASSFPTITGAGSVNGGTYNQPGWSQNGAAGGGGLAAPQPPVSPWSHNSGVGYQTHPSAGQTTGAATIQPSPHDPAGSVDFRHFPPQNPQFQTGYLTNHGAYPPYQSPAPVSQTVTPPITAANIPPILVPSKPPTESYPISAMDDPPESNPKTPVMTPRFVSLSSLPSTDDMLRSSPGIDDNEVILQPQVLSIEEIKQMKNQHTDEPQKDIFEDDNVLEKFQRDFQVFEAMILRINGSEEEKRSLWKDFQDQQLRDAAKYAIGVARCFPRKNRDARIMPYDASRVVIQNGPEDYINASFIEGMPNLTSRVICTQTPLLNTCSDFWTMVIEQGVEVIAAVMTDYEVKEFRYWPTSRHSPVSFGPITVSLQKESTEEAHWTVRLLHVSHSVSKVTKSVVHLRFHGWPPNDVPAKPYAFTTFIKEVQQYQRKQRVLSKPFVVHCQFGTGPSGIFCAALSFVSSVDASAGIPDLRDVIRRLRNCRKFMVDSVAELMFLYQVCLTYGWRVLHQHGALPTYVEVAADRPLPSVPVTPVKPPTSGLAVPDVLSDIREELQRRHIPPSRPDTPDKNFRPSSCDGSESAAANATVKGDGPVFLTNLPQAFTSLTTLGFNLNSAESGVPEKKNKVTKESFSSVSATTVKGSVNSDDPLSSLDPFWKMNRK